MLRKNKKYPSMFSLTIPTRRLLLLSRLFLALAFELLLSLETNHKCPQSSSFTESMHCHFISNRNPQISGRSQKCFIFDICRSCIL